MDQQTIDREAAEWAQRVDSEHLAAALAIPSDTPLRQAARIEWDRREAEARAHQAAAIRASVERP